MIVEGLFKLFFKLLGFLLDLIPVWDFVGIDWSGLDAFADAIGYINFFVPVDVLVGCMMVLIVYDNFQFFVNIVKWIIKLIPTVG